MQQEIMKPVHQDKVVFIIDTKRNQEEKSIYPQSYEYVEAVLNSVLRKNNISTEKLFIGGKKEILSGFYHLSSKTITMMTFLLMMVQIYTKTILILSN